jgi:hypothetical protein
MVKRTKSVVKDDGQVRGAMMRRQRRVQGKSPAGGKRGFFFDASNLGKLAGLTRTVLKRSKPIRGSERQSIRQQARAGTVPLKSGIAFGRSMSITAIDLALEPFRDTKVVKVMNVGRVGGFLRQQMIDARNSSLLALQMA